MKERFFENLSFARGELARGHYSDCTGPTHPTAPAMVVALGGCQRCQDLLFLYLVGQSALCVVLFLTGARFCLAVSADARALSAVSET